MPQRFVVLCFLAMSSTVGCTAAAQAPSLSGQWEGAVQIPGYELRVVVDLRNRIRNGLGR